MENQIQVIARAVIVDDGHILLTQCTNRSGTYTYLPGGHVELGETSKIALARELHEELGVAEAAISQLLATHESFWHDKNNVLQHEINLLFKTTVPGFSRHTTPTSQEAHIAFAWVALDQLTEANLLPMAMRSHLKSLVSKAADDLVTD
jgi:8-oxo-dGTP diphosphatase